MQVQAFERRVAELVQELASFSGFRTIWLDGAGNLCHSEPDDELEEWNFHYLTTVMRPSLETLTALLVPLVPLESGNDELPSWRPRLSIGAQLVPAQA